MLSFVDEAQLLSTLCTDDLFFKGGEDATARRPLFSPVVKSFVRVVNSAPKWFRHTVFTGTALTMVSHLRSVVSSMLKPKSTWTTVHSGLPTLAEKNVRAFLGFYVDWDMIAKSVADHTCRWLVGRPRFAATFLHGWINSYKNDEDESAASNRLLRIVESFVECLSHLRAPSR